MIFTLCFKYDFYKLLLFFALFFLFLNSVFSDEYFQQEVSYDIQVELNDSAHSLSCYEKLIYKNNSPDTLNYIWFHIWPNAYKNDSSAFAKQLIRLGNTKFHYSKDKDRGYIDSLNFLIDGKNTNWEYHSDWIDVIKVSLPDPLFPNQSIVIETPFYVKLPKIFSRLGHSGNHYEITQWYPKPAVYDKEGWHPMPYLNMGEFYSEFGTFDVKITLPKEYRIMATGDLINGDEELKWLDSLAEKGDLLNTLTPKKFKKELKKMEKSRKNQKKSKGDKLSNNRKYKTIHFRQEDVHDFAWFADPNWIVQKGDLFLKKSNKNVTLWSMYLPKNGKIWKESIQYLHDSGYWYSKFYGDYPYNHITAVDGDMSAGGGMEYPNITVISRAPSKDLLEFVIMHEVGHNWFYGILGNNERDFTWLDEGLNEYSNIRYWEKKYGNRDNQVVIQDFVQNTLEIGKNFDIHLFHYLSVASNPKSLDAQPLNISADQNFNYSNYGQNYNRVAVMFRFLQHYIGEEAMNTVMRDFYETWKFRHPRPKDLFASFDKHVDQNLEQFFENVFDKTSYIDYSIKSSNNGFLIENKGTFIVPIEVAFFDKKGNEIERSWFKNIEAKKEIESPSDCIKAVIDPDQLMPDIVRINNSSKRKVKFHFIYDTPSYYDIDLNVIPNFYSFNRYNGYAPGISIFNGLTPGSGNRFFNLSFLYDLINDRPLARMAFRIKFQNVSKFHSGSYGAQIEDYQGRKGINVGFNGLIKKPLTKSPKLTLMANLFYHHLDQEAFDNRIFETENYLIGSFSMNGAWSPNIFQSHTLFSKIDLGTGFLKLKLGASTEIKFAKKMKTKIIVNSSSFPYSEKIPRQFNNFIFGDVDPNFQKIVLNRTSDDDYIKVLKSTYHGGGIRGISTNDYTISTTNSIWNIKLTQSLPYLPGNAFLDLSKHPDLVENHFIASGFILGPIIIPLYQNWETENKYPNNFGWVFDRIRVNITTNFNVGNN